MSEAAQQVSAVKRGLGARLWEYQGERFPIFKHGVLIAAFGASAVCLSALLREAVPDWRAIVVAVLVLFGLFFQLRVADEHKDNEEDTKFRPERPVPRGLVTLGELRVVAFVVAAIQVGLTVWIEWRLLGSLALVWAWMADEGVLRARLAEEAACRLHGEPHGDHAADRFLRDGLRLAAGRPGRA